MYRVEIRRKAVKELSRIDRQDRERILRAIDGLAENPCPDGSKKLRSREGWRLRVGVFRILYRIEEERFLVLVVKVGHRRDFYR